MMLRLGSRAVRRAGIQTHSIRYCSETPKEDKPVHQESELTAKFELPNKGEGPEKVVYDLAEKVLSLNVLQYRLFQKIINESMGKSEMWEYDLVMNLSKALAGGGGGGGGFMMQPGAMMQAAPATPATPAAEAATEEEDAEPAAPVVEQTEFTVKLTQIDPAQKVKTIKKLKETRKMGLKEAKDAIEKLPSVIGEKLSKEDSEALKAALAEVGGIVSIV
eukprot:TRINITY_DN603_c2_g1_i1.p4 TRINITY_DN603_c2_g1~~TRINITY_DN603_c2_g1_i1.p4  ORF type:complete len:219 (+),score=57.46 TRINITY_DN603_c2_g1_i1:117-773(+)